MVNLWLIIGITINIWLVVTGTMEFYDFPSIGNGIIIPTDVHELIFFRGVGQPPTREKYGDGLHMAGENLELEKMGLYYAGDILTSLIWKLETIFFLLWNRSYDMFWFMMAHDMLYASWWFCNTDDPLRAVDLAIKDRDIMRVNQWIIEVGLFKNGGYSNLSMFCNKFLGWNRIIICNYQIWDNSISQMWIGTILVIILYINH